MSETKQVEKVEENFRQNIFDKILPTFEKYYLDNNVNDVNDVGSRNYYFRSKEEREEYLLAYKRNLSILLRFRDAKDEEKKRMEENIIIATIYLPTIF
jgi:hypothetical protein